MPDGPSAIIGYGLTGRSLTRWLSLKLEPFKVFDNDPRQSYRDPGQTVSVGINVTNTGGWTIQKWDEALEGVKCIYVSPGVSLLSPGVRIAREREIPVLSDLDLFNDNIGKKPVIGVTGTNGKSTVVALIEHFLKADDFSVAVGGNYGRPALDLLNEEVDIYVLELSSFQLEKIQNLNLHTGVFLNFSDDHLDYHGTSSYYLAAKRRIFQFSERKIYDRANEATFPPTEGAGSLSFGFGDPPESDSWGLRESPLEYSIRRGSAQICSVPKSFLRGRDHLLLNILAASASIYPFTTVTKFESIESFKGLRHRFELIDEINGVLFINDSKATNANATETALRNLEPREQVILILGGDAKGVDLGVLESSIKEKVFCLVALALDPTPFLALGQRCGIETIVTLSMQEAVKEAYRLANLRSDIKKVILSPACASFDLFKNYRDRGISFEDAVRKLREVE